MPEPVRYDDLLAMLQVKLVISHSDLEAAAQDWSDTVRAIKAGVGERLVHGLTEHVKLSDRFLTLHRYCHDAELLMERHVEHRPGKGSRPSRRTLLVIDPHLMRAWSEYWDASMHTGFDFVDQEHDDWNIADIPRSFETFIYDSVFREADGCALLEAGRIEVSEHVAYYAERHVQNRTIRDVEDIAKSLARTLDDIAEGMSADMSESFVSDSFRQLMKFVAVPAVANNIALSRLVRLMRRGNFYAPDALLRQALHSGAIGLADDDAITRFATLQRLLRDNVQLAARSRNSFIKAYETFLDTTSLDSEGTGRRGAVGRLRGGEMHDLMAMHELHMLNVCLDAAGLDCEFAYVTLSTRMYNFVRAFDEATLCCHLLHPRTAHLVNQDFNLFEGFTNSASALTPLLKKCKDDGKITSAEIDRYEDLIKPPLVALRNALTFEVAHAEERRREILSAIDRFAQDHVADLPTRKRILEGLGYVELMIDRSRDALSSRVDKSASATETDLWAGYEELRKSIAAVKDEREEPRVLIRKFEQGNTRRFTCVPLSGGYRHMFVLHNSFLDKVLTSVGQAADCMTMRELLSAVRQGAATVLQEGSGHSALHREKALATEFFVKACFAAVDRDWMLAHTTAKLAHETLMSGLLGQHMQERRSIESENIARAYLLDQEIRFLRHLCRRALAEASAPNRRLERWLSLAAEDLNACAHLATVIPVRFAPFEGATGPVSLRITLAAIGLRIEWLYQMRSKPAGYQRIPLGLHLPETKDRTLAWYNFDDALSGDEAGFGKLDAIAVAIGSRCEEQLRLIDQQQTGHNAGFWQFLRLRAYAIEMLTSSMASLFDDTCDTIESFDHDEIACLRVTQQRYEAFVAANGCPTSAGRQHHFLECLLLYYEASLLMEGPLLDEGQVPAVAEKIDAIDRHCARLYRFGFPRAVVRELKSGLVSDFIDRLRDKYEIASE